MKLPYIAAATVVAVVSALVFYKAYGPQKCQWRRAAFDIGSGSTKIKVADVDICEKKIVNILLEDSIKVDFKSDISKQGHFSVYTLEAGLSALRQLKAKSEKLSPPPEQFSAVATSAFRDSENSDGFIEAVRTSRGLKFPVTIIDQEKEARLGFYAALGRSGEDINSIAVWDIGGGSMQISTWLGGRLGVYQGQLASVPFKNHIIQELKNLNPNSTKSPNPIGQEHLLKALEFAKQVASTDIDRKIRNVISQKKVIGIGGVHYFALRKQIGVEKGSAYELEQLRQVLNERINWDDKKLNDPYSDTQVSNLALVLAFMEALGLKAVLPLNINMADGLLIDTQLWQRQLYL